MTAPEPPALSTMRLAIDGEIGTLTLDRPDRLNAMSPELIGELAEVMPWLAEDARLRALIVTGAGRAFSAGGDVSWFRRGLDDPDVDLPESVRQGAEVLHRGIEALRRIPYPVVAAINGVAAGAGVSLALACDVRIASADAFFAIAYGRIGASPDGGMTYFLPRVIGPARAIEILLEDPDMPAREALERGLVTEVVEAGELAAVARARAEALAAKAPHYVRMSKLLVAASLQHGLAEHLALERDGIAASMATEDLRAGVTAFFAGEPPRFGGAEPRN